ncbi:hypothetical protein VNO77_01634 [Canavalia gladiata]|uniref:Uncharacterized protein n=1 Tax=Canavalia gladiata TaxID=3824 RepID=A0AAN9R557_CANGL
MFLHNTRFELFEMLRISRKRRSHTDTSSSSESGLRDVKIIIHARDHKAFKLARELILTGEFSLHKIAKRLVEVGACGVLDYIDENIALN